MLKIMVKISALSTQSPKLDSWQRISAYYDSDIQNETPLNIRKTVKNNNNKKKLSNERQPANDAEREGFTSYRGLRYQDATVSLYKNLRKQVPLPVNTPRRDGHVKPNQPCR